MVIVLAVVTFLWMHTRHAGPVDVHRLAVTEAAMDYCRTAYPSALPEISERVRQLTRGSGAAELEAIRQGDAYRRAHASMEQFVAKIDAKNAQRLCTGPLISSAR